MLMVRTTKSWASKFIFLEKEILVRFNLTAVSYHSYCQRLSSQSGYESVSCTDCLSKALTKNIKGVSFSHTKQVAISNGRDRSFADKFMFRQFCLLKSISKELGLTNGLVEQENILNKILGLLHIFERVLL